jgi:hypothetical protein
MTCDLCVHAKWNRTSNGRLHPNKQGRCAFVWAPPPLPRAFSFSWGNRGVVPQPNGGWIERGDKSMDGCPCFTSTPAPSPNDGGAQ